MGAGDGGRVGGEGRKGVGGGARGGGGGARHGGPLHLIMIGKRKRKRDWMQQLRIQQIGPPLRSDICILSPICTIFSRTFLVRTMDSGHVFVFLYFEAEIKHRSYKSEEGPTISKLRRKRAGT